MSKTSPVQNARGVLIARSRERSSAAGNPRWPLHIELSSGARVSWRTNVNSSCAFDVPREGAAVAVETRWLRGERQVTQIEQPARAVSA